MLADCLEALAAVAIFMACVVGVIVLIGGLLKREPT